MKIEKAGKIKAKTRYKVKIECLLCHRVYDCGLKESPDACAERHRLWIVEARKGERACRFYLCDNCLAKLMFGGVRSEKNRR